MDCRICGQTLSAARVEVGHTGCVDCEQLHLWGQVAEGARTGRMPAWWIDPSPWDAQDTKEDLRGVYDALKGHGDPLAGYTIPLDFYGTDH